MVVIVRMSQHFSEYFSYIIFKLFYTNDHQELRAMGADIWGGWSLNSWCEMDSTTYGLNPLGTAGLYILPVLGTVQFWGTFYFFNSTSLLFVMVANSPHYSPYIKSSCPPDRNVIIIFALPSSWCSKWRHKDATIAGHIGPSRPLPGRDIHVLPV